jgi:sterol desaturase/sphingolipid hydroxylase (fatty acid hydroxylase superfamily)
MFTDLVWYCYHWLGHKVNFLWAAHIVHHQSEEYNLTVAARVTIFQAYIRTLFWCVLPLIGFPVDMVMGILVFHGAYSFFTHTQLGKNLRFLEVIFITPSLHGVHHASNKKYLDKNFGDVFVFWDKLFGTFQKEEEQPVYGLTQPFESHSFLWQHFHYYLELIYLAKTKTGWWNKIKVFFVSPECMDASIRPLLERKWLKTEKRQIAAPLKSYLNFQLSLCLLLLAISTYLFNKTGWLLKAEMFVFIILTLINVGAIIEQKKYIFYLELIRLWQAFLFVGLVTDAMLLIVIFSIIIQLLLYFLPIKFWYYKMLYKEVI